MKTLLTLIVLITGTMASAASDIATSLECSGYYYNARGRKFPSKGEPANISINGELRNQSAFLSKSLEGYEYASVEAEDKYIVYSGIINRSESQSDVLGELYIKDKQTGHLLGEINDVVLSKNISDRSSFKLLVRLSDATIQKIHQDTGGKDKYGNPLDVHWVEVSCRQEK